MKTADKYILVVAAILNRSITGIVEVAIFRRGPGSTGSGHYEFPGGKVESGESEIQALRREIVEELGVEIEVGPLLGETFHQYPAKNIHLRFYLVADPGKNFVLTEHDDYFWVDIAKIDRSIMSEGDREIVGILQKMFLERD